MVDRSLYVEHANSRMSEIHVAILIRKKIRRSVVTPQSRLSCEGTQKKSVSSTYISLVRDRSFDEIALRGDFEGDSSILRSARADVTWRQSDLLSVR